MHINNLKEKELLIANYFCEKTRKELTAHEVFDMWSNWFKVDFRVNGKPVFCVVDNELMYRKSVKNLDENIRREYNQTFQKIYKWIKRAIEIDSHNKAYFHQQLDYERKKEFTRVVAKAKHISAKYGFKKIVNFYQIEEYGFTTLENSERIAGTLIENNISLKGLSREYILRTFGIETADRVFPQYKYENRQGTSAKSDYLTGEIASVVLNTIKEQGYIFERDVNINGAIGTQWKKSIQEILDSYGLKKVKLNKELKEKYGIEGNGYPCIIIEDEVNF